MDVVVMGDNLSTKTAVMSYCFVTLASALASVFVEDALVIPDSS